MQDGDFVSIDLSATVDGKAVEEAATTGLDEVGSGQLIDGLDEALIGLNAGTRRNSPRSSWPVITPVRRPSSVSRSGR